MLGGSLMCMGTCGNGVEMHGKIMKRGGKWTRFERALIRPGACCVAALGSISPGAAVQRSASGPPRVSVQECGLAFVRRSGAGVGGAAPVAGEAEPCPEGRRKGCYCRSRWPGKRALLLVVVAEVVDPVVTNFMVIMT